MSDYKEETVICEHCCEYHIPLSQQLEQVAGELCPCCCEYHIPEDET